MESQMLEKKVPSGEETLVRGQEELKGMLTKVPERHRGLQFSRTLSTFAPDPVSLRLERAFAEVWAEHNDEHSSRSVLGRLLISVEEDDLFDLLREKCAPETAREWAIAELVASTLMQWIGTTYGENLIKEAYERAGGRIDIVHPHEPD